MGSAHGLGGAQDLPIPLAYAAAGAGAALAVSFLVLAHNLYRGAAGAAVLNAELCRERGLLSRNGGASA